MLVTSAQMIIKHIKHIKHTKPTSLSFKTVLMVIVGYQDLSHVCLGVSPMDVRRWGTPGISGWGGGNEYNKTVFHSKLSSDQVDGRVRILVLNSLFVSRR